MKTRIALIALTLVLAVGFAFAQSKKTTRKTTGTNKSAEANKTRSRRATPAAQTEPAAGETGTESEPKPEASPDAKNVDAEKPAAEENKSASSPDESKPTDTSTPASTASQQPDTPADPIATLQNDIDAAENGPERISLQLKLAEELVNAGKKTEAVALLHSIVATDVFDPQGFYNTGNSFARLADNDGAIEAYRKAIEQRKGRYSRALNNLGVVLLRVGRWDEAHQALTSALKLENFRYPEASYNLGRLYAAQGQDDLAVREWHRVLAMDPQHTAAADALKHIGSERRVEVEPARSSSMRSSKPTERSESQPTKATVPSSRSLVLNSVSFDLLQRARVSNEKGRVQEAIDNYKRLLSRESGYFPPANLELGFALMSLKRYDEALANLQMVADRDGSRYPISYFHVARVYELKNDLKQAELFFSKTVTAFGSQNSQFLLDVSRVREKQGDYKGALESMEQYLTQARNKGVEPAWTDERLTALREKLAKTSKP